MKKIKVFLFLTLLVSLSLFKISTVDADCGPKASVVIDFINFSEEDYYVTLLSYNSSTGPFSADDLGDDYYGNDEEIFLKFVDYEDSFYFIGYLEHLTADCQYFVWNYYPPKQFKILVYFPTIDSFYVTDIYERYAFDTYYMVDGSNLVINDSIEGNVVVSKNYDYSGEIASFFVRVILTILFEIGIAILFKFKNKYQLGIILITNIVTQVLLNLSLNLFEYYDGFLLAILNYLLFEFVVLLIEAIVYKISFTILNKKKEIPIGKPIIYAIFANVLSFALGLIIAIYLPNFF